MKTFFYAACFLVSVTVLSGHGLAFKGGDDRKPPSTEKVERMRKRIETMKMWKLTQVLDLDEQRAAELFPVLNRYNKKRLDVMKRMRENMRKLRGTVDSAPEDELQVLIRNLRDAHAELKAVNEEELESFRGLLSVREFAKFVIFKQDFNREMKRRIARIRDKREKRDYRERRTPGRESFPPPVSPEQPN